jgi:cell division protein FtsN
MAVYQIYKLFEYKNMTKDYAKRRRTHLSHSSQKRYSQQQHVLMPAWGWMSVGLLLGLGLSAMAYWKLNQNPKPQLVASIDIQEEVPPQVENKTKPTAKNLNKPKTTTPTVAKSDSSRFDFYTVLPTMNLNESQANDPSVDATTLALAIKNTDPKPENSAQITELAPDPDEVAPISSTQIEEPIAKTPLSYIIQAGTFRQISQAEELKAQLAITGFEASIQTFKMGAKDTRYRVLIGPFASEEQANLQQKQLEQAQQLHSVVLKIGV